MRRVVVTRTGDDGPSGGVAAGWVLGAMGAFIALTVVVGGQIGKGDDSGLAVSSTTVVEPESPILEKPPETTVPVDDGTFLVTPGENSSVDLDELATAVKQRLSAAGHPAVSAFPEGGGVRVDPGEGPLTQPAIEDLLTEPGRLEIRAVRRTPAVARCADPPTAQGADDDSLYPEYEFSGERSGQVVACYAVAPGGISNAAIERARATVIAPDQDGNRDDDWAVDLIVSTEGIETFNELAAACKHRESPCDAGLAAIALDQVVLMAPRVADEEFGRFDIQISGDIDEETANSMVAALTTEPLPRGLEFSS